MHHEKTNITYHAFDSLDTEWESGYKCITSYIHCVC